MLQLFWHCLDLTKSDEEFIKGSFCELAGLLAKPPTGITFKAIQLPRNIISKTENILRKHQRDLLVYYREISKFPSSIKPFPLLIYCVNDSPTAQTAKKQNRLAKWGLTLPGCISIVYSMNNKYILWHEAIHLFGVDDCYDENNPDGPLRCELKNCLMQYAPTEHTVGKWPFLCQKSIQAIQRSDKV